MIEPTLLGPFKLLLLVGLFYSWFRVFGNGRNVFHGFQVPAVVAAAFLVLLVLLESIGLYDTLTLFVLLFLILLLPFYRKRSSLLDLSRMRTRVIFSLVRKTQQYKKTKFWNQLKVFSPNQGFSMAFWVPSLVVAVTFFSRYLLLHYDSYTLSELWLYHLSLVRGIDTGLGLANPDYVPVEFLLINVYHKLTGISEEVALHSFGLIENALLAFVLFRFTAKISGSRLLIPSLAVCWFALGYTYLPMTVSLLQEHNPSYLAWCFIIPVLGMAWQKLEMPGKKSSAMVAVLTLAAALLHPFTAVLLLGVLLVSLFLFSGNNWRYNGRIVLSWAATLLGCYLGFLLYNYLVGRNTSIGLEGLFLSVNTYEYFPQHKVSWEILSGIYGFLVLLGSVLSILLKLRFGRRIGSPMGLIVGIGLLLFLDYISPAWLDTALLKQGLSVGLVLLVGTVLGLLYDLLRDHNFIKYRPVSLGYLFGGILIISVITGWTPTRKAVNDPLKKEILQVYNRLTTDQLPFTYAVVNNPYAVEMSQGEHDFIHNSEFVATYLKRDSLNYQYRGQEEFFKENPEYILPESVFVFVSREGKSAADSRLFTPVEFRESFFQIIGQLEKRGRSINLYHSGDYLEVFEVVNDAGKSSLKDLIFDL
jgi:hypothetical protein